MLLRSEGSLTFFQKNSDELVKNLQARAEAAVLSGKNLSGFELQTLTALNDTLGNTTFPALLKGHLDDQAELNAGVQSLTGCNEIFADDSRLAAIAKEDVDATAQEHRYCRGNQSELKVRNDDALTILESLVKDIKGQSPPHKSPPGICGASTRFLQDATAAEKYFSTGLSEIRKLEKQYKTSQQEYTEKKANYTSAKGALENKTRACDSAQRSLEVGHCQWLGRATAASKSLDACWNRTSSTFSITRSAALDSASQRKLVYAATKRIQCFLSVLFMKRVSKARQKLVTCQTLRPDESKFDLVNTTAPNKSGVQSLGDLSYKAGDEDWKTNMYAGIGNVSNVTSCATVAHLCKPDEYVQFHRCKGCEPGKWNAAGDDAVGGNTKCSPVICESNQYVISKKCIACAAGTQNAGGDDASGNDTSCEPIVCGRGQRVKNKACHVCPPGTTNEAGGHKATGADTSCDAIKCQQDQYVEANSCRTCAPGTTNAAGDDATGPNTTCDAVKCARNKKVMSNRCVGCPPGRFKDAGDKASGADTKCKPTKCPSNYHVRSNSCTACPDGTTRTSGDDASKADTTCSPILCAANQRVLSHSCVPCSSGQVNAAGDDASGSDTACHASAWCGRLSTSLQSTKCTEIAASGGFQLWAASPGLKYKYYGFDDNDGTRGKIGPRNICMLAAFGEGNSVPSGCEATTSSYAKSSGSDITEHWFGRSSSSCSYNSRLFSAGSTITWSQFSKGNSCGNDGDRDSAMTELVCYFPRSCKR